MPNGKICFKCSEFLGEYNPDVMGGIDYWYCKAGFPEDRKTVVKEDSALPAACPCKFMHALSDLRTKGKLPEVK